MILHTKELKSLNTSAKKLRKGIYLSSLDDSSAGTSLALPGDKAPSYTKTVVLVLTSRSKMKRAVEFQGTNIRLLGIWDGDNTKQSSMFLRNSYESMGLHFIFAPHVLDLSSWRITEVLVEPTLHDFLDLDIGECLLYSPVPTKMCCRKTMLHGVPTYSLDFSKLAKES